MIIYPLQTYILTIGHFLHIICTEATLLSLVIFVRQGNIFCWISYLKQTNLICYGYFSFQNANKETLKYD